MTKPYNMNDLKGLGGVLILVGMGVTLSPFYLLNGFMEFPPLFSAETFPNLDFGLKTLVISEALFYGVMTLVTAYVAFLFFSKRREFPNWFIGTYLTFVAFHIIDTATALMLFPEENIAESSGRVAGHILAAAIWILYVVKSERVRLTFIEE